MNIKLKKDIFKELKFLVNNDFYKDIKLKDIGKTFVNLYESQNNSLEYDDDIKASIINEINEFVKNSNSFKKSDEINELNKTEFIGEIEELENMIDDSWITVLIIEPKKEPYYREIKNDVFEFQKIVKRKCEKSKN